MELIGEKLTFTPEECARLIELGVLPRLIELGVLSNPKLSSNQEGSLIASAEKEKGADAHSPSIDPEIFFRAISPSMAKILLAFARSDGDIAQAQLEQDTGLHGGSLRRPNGAINRRLREASRERLKAAYEVVGSGSDGRVYRIPDEFLQFLRQHTTDIEAKMPL